MNRLTVVAAVLIAFALLAPAALAQEEAGKLVKEARELFEKKDWPGALKKLKLAQQMGVEGQYAIEVALHTGAIYAEMGQGDLARQNFEKFLATNPTAEVPGTFTQKMGAALDGARGAFPIVSDIGLQKEAFKPYKEKLDITFVVKAEEDVLRETSVEIRLLAEARNEVMLETSVRLDPAAPVQRFAWDGKSKYGRYVEAEDYSFTVEAVREDGWKHSATFAVRIGGNIVTTETEALRSKALRIESLSGQRRLSYLPDKQFVKLGEKPMKSSMTGFWNHIYYVPLGAIRDGLDFPIKYLLSLKYVGHALTATAPFVTGYGIGNALWSIDRADYYDPVMGYDEDAWDHDEQVIEQRAMASGVLGPVWGLAYAGIMSVVSWAGTEGGIARGFTSYIDSNAFRNGYKAKYFFPNYRSLDFATSRIDQEELARLKTKINHTNQSIRNEIASTNRNVDLFNRNKMQRFKREVSVHYKQKLHEYAEMTVEPGK